MRGLDLEPRPHTRKALGVPARVLRDGILRSKRVAKLSPQAEVFYRRLMSVVDDFGRYYADPALLLSDCYPLRPSWADENSLSLWLRECVEAELILPYQHNSNDYLQIVDFRQRTKPAQKSKFPDLPGISGHGPEKSAFARASSSPTPTPPTTAPTTSEISGDIETRFEAMYDAHPKKDGRMLAQRNLTEALLPAMDREELMTRIERSHAAWVPEWMKLEPKFVPNLAGWIRDQRYLDDLPGEAERKRAAKELEKWNDPNRYKLGD